MRKLLFVLFAVAAFVNAFGQAKKPTIMVIPADIYCNRAGFTQEFDNQGKKTVVPDFKKAMQNDENLRLVITKISGMMADRGFPLKDLEAELKKLETEAAEEAMMSSSTSGAGIAESPIDVLMRTAKADIIMDLDFSVTKAGPNKSIKFNLRGLDAYTSKAIANAAGVGNPSTASDPAVLMEEAVLQHLDNFNAQLMKHFEDLFANGREVIFQVKCFDNSSTNLETEFDGDELNKIIDDWMGKATVKGRFNQVMSTTNKMKFEQVRIPLFDEKGKAIDAKGFIQPLRKMLKGAPYNIESKIHTKGLGEVWLILGEK